MSEYERAIAALFARTGTTAKLGLERTAALLERLGHPERRYSTLHVAGTNGKGSVVAMVYALLRAKGLSVGRYTSPHLVDFRERIVVDDEQIGAAEVLNFLREWEPLADQLGATFFEITTVLAFDHFARRKVDIAVIETGMGGRLDATNVVAPLATAITSVGMDHMEHLGDSLVKIAREKAGILKPGVPAVLGDLPVEARDEVARCAIAAGAAALVDARATFPARVLAVTTDGTRVSLEIDGKNTELTVGLAGEQQAANLSVALAMAGAAGYPVSVSDAAQVLPAVRLAGRFQRIGKFIVDVAHNLDGMRALRRTLEEVRPARPIVAVVGILRDKPWLEMLCHLAPAVDHLIATIPPGVPGDRVWDLDEVRNSPLGAGVDILPDFEAAIGAAESDAESVLVTGSFYTAGACLRLLKESRCDISLMQGPLSR